MLINKLNPKINLLTKLILNKQNLPKIKFKTTINLHPKIIPIINKIKNLNPLNNLNNNKPKILFSLLLLTILKH